MNIDQNNKDKDTDINSIVSDPDIISIEIKENSPVDDIESPPINNEEYKVVQQDSSNSNSNSETEYMSDDDVPGLTQKQYTLIYIGFVIAFIGLVVASIVSEPDNASQLLLKKGLIYVCSFAIMILNGYIFRNKYPIKVNYTRKVNHIVTWSFPIIFDQIIDVEENTISTLWNVLFAMTGFVIMMKPPRKNDCTGIVNLIYSTLDRPEDRPNTLKWLVWQGIGVGLALLPFAIIWDHWHKGQFALIPLIILTFGDGLAEPVGVKWGKHKYKVIGLCTDNEYTRSFEGSFMVYITGVIIVCILYNEFATAEFIANVIIVPIVGTLFEAIAPHTLDNPLIILTTSIVITITHAIKLSTD